MTKWHIEFIVDGAKFAETMEKLVPMKIEDLNFKIVAGTPKHIRPGDKSAWEIAAHMATGTPQPMAYFRERFQKLGVPNGTIYNAMRIACEKHLIRRTTVKGVPHYALEKGKPKS